MSTDKRKQSLYFSADTLKEIESEAKRLDRSMSWVVTYAWRYGKAALIRIPATEAA